MTIFLHILNLSLQVFDWNPSGVLPLTSIPFKGACANFTNPNATTSNVANVNLTNLHSNDSSYIYVTCNGMVSWEIGKFIVFF